MLQALTCPLHLTEGLLPEWKSGPLRDVASSFPPTRLLGVRGMDPWSHLKPNHVECVCQTVHVGVFSPDLSGRG